jgi:SAM-dependent methyltransferase
MDETPVARRYQSPTRLATQLYGEWGDLLFPEDVNDAFPAPLPDLTRPGQHYRELAALAAQWAEAYDVEATTICDVGGSTGRLLRELAARFPSAEELHLVEPSEQFTTWAARMLGHVEFNGWVPWPGPPGESRRRRVAPEHRPTPLPATIHQTVADALPVPDGHFDLVTCCNVIDRVEDPGRFTAQLARLIRPGGLLVLASPLDFRPEMTPPGQWLTDLRQLVSGPGWETITASAETVYPVLRHTRQLRLFRSQVIGLIRSSAPSASQHAVTAGLRMPSTGP